MDDLTQGLVNMENAVNYNNWIWDNIKDHLGNRILEVGGGLGVYTKRLADKEFVATLEIHEELAKKLNNKFQGSNIKVIQGNICDKNVVSLVKGFKLDTVICLNVLEHIENDKLALFNMHEALTDNGTLILLVPAMKALFGSMDKAQEHCRRYNKADLEKLLGDSGFSVIKKHYMNILGAPGWFLFGRIFKRKVASQNSIMFYDKFIVPWLSKAEGMIKPPIGQSLLFICKKK